MAGPSVFVGDLSNRGASRVQVSRLKLARNATALACWCLLMPTLYLLVRGLRAPGASRIHRSFHGGVRRLFNLRLNVRGLPRREGPTLYVANHASYLDVFVLGALLDAGFIAKAEVANWPVLGKLARLQQTLFFERDARLAKVQIDRLREELGRGRSLILFPEGTSTPGTHVERFHASLFEAAVQAGSEVRVQPVTIAYTHYDGQPMAPADRDYYAWYLPMTFLPHFLYAMALRVADVRVDFHEPVAAACFSDRKSLAQHCEQEVRQGLQEALASPAAGADSCSG